MIFLGGAILELWRGCQFTRWHWVLHAMASHLILEWKISFGVLDKKSKPKDWSWRRPPSTCRRPLCKTQRIASHAQGGWRSHSAVIRFSFLVKNDGKFHLGFCPAQWIGCYATQPSCFSWYKESTDTFWKSHLDPEHCQWGRAKERE